VAEVLSMLPGGQFDSLQVGNGSEPSGKQGSICRDSF
jgi:hypothetical protein